MLGYEAEFLPTIAEAQAGGAAGAEREHGLIGLEAGAFAMLLGV